MGSTTSPPAQTAEARGEPAGPRAGPDRPPRGTASPAPDDRRLGATDAARLVVILSAAFMVVLDFFIVVVALPSIGASLRASAADLQLIVAGYALANAATLVAGGRLGDLLGRQRMFIVGSVAFALASAGCAVATSAFALVAMRFVQGVAGGLLHPQVLALLGLQFAGAKRAKAFAWYAMAMGLAGISGQLLGGALVELDLAGLGWRSCFLINLPIAALGIGGVVALVEERGALGSGRIDVIGMLLAAAALLALITPLSYGREHLPIGVNAALVAAAVVLGAVFWRHQLGRERAGASPMLSPALLRLPAFAWGVATVLVFYTGIASFYVVLGLHLQGPLAMSPGRSGLYFALMGCSFFVASLFGPRLQRRWGTRAIASGALVLCAGHLLHAALQLWSRDAAGLVIALVVEGAGIGLVMGPLVAAALARVPAERSGVAAGVVSTMQSTGNAVGVAAVSSLYFAASGPRAVYDARGFALALIALAALAAMVALLHRRAPA